MHGAHEDAAIAPEGAERGRDDPSEKSQKTNRVLTALRQWAVQPDAVIWQL